MDSGADRPGDLGRRVAHRRHELGLSHEQLAARAGMAPGYLAYLEERPASPTSWSLNRLARALETSPGELLGGGADVPGGHAPAAAEPVLVVLGEQECRRLIAPGGVGRLAFAAGAAPVVLPVNYTVHEGAVVFRTDPDGEISGFLGTEVREVSFQVDRLDPAMSEGWSVLATGPARRVRDAAEAAVLHERAPVRPWAGGDRDAYVEVTPHRLTGRRIHAR